MRCAFSLFDTAVGPPLANRDAGSRRCCAVASSLRCGWDSGDRVASASFGCASETRGSRGRERFAARARIGVATGAPEHRSTGARSWSRRFFAKRRCAFRRWNGFAHRWQYGACSSTHSGASTLYADVTSRRLCATARRMPPDGVNGGLASTGRRRRSRWSHTACSGAWSLGRSWKADGRRAEAGGATHPGVSGR